VWANTYISGYVMHNSASIAVDKSYVTIADMIQCLKNFRHDTYEKIARYEKSCMVTIQQEKHGAYYEE